MECQPRCAHSWTSGCPTSPRSASSVQSAAPRWGMTRSSSVATTSHCRCSPVPPCLVHRQHLPAHRQEPRVYQQPEIQHGRALVQRGRVEHEDQASIAPEGEAVADEAGPERDHDDLLVGQTAGQAAFDAGRRGRADADERLRHPRQARGARQHDAQDTEGQRFAAVSMHIGQKRAQLARPLAPQPLPCVHTAKRSFPMTRV
jgi:hypothetical protein